VLNHIRIQLLSHLRVSINKAEEAKDFLRKNNFLNESFLPIKEEESILWPLNCENVEFEGEIVECEGLRQLKKSRDYRLKLNDNISKLAPRSFDIFGEIAIIRLADDLIKNEKEIAGALLESHDNIKTVCIDLGVEGEYRLRNLRVIDGRDSFISIHKENGMKFEADISKVYFSPRLATERERVSSLSGEDEFVLDAFSGVAPFSVFLAKRGCKILALDSNPEAKKWALRNFTANKLSKDIFNYYTTKFEEYDFGNNMFDRIIMNNPTNCLPYLGKALSLLMAGGWIHFYHISPKDDLFNIEEYLSSGYECVRKREVHPYSPSSSLFAFDIKRF